MQDLQLQHYAPLWTTDRHQYVLVEVVLVDTVPGTRPTYLDIYRRDGTYCAPVDPELAAEVAARMRSAGVEVWEGDAWVLERKMAPYMHLWTSPPGMQFVIRRPEGHPQGPAAIHYSDGSRQYIYEEAVERAVIERMVAAGVERIDQCELPSGEDSNDLEHEANRWVAAEYHDWHAGEYRAACRFRLVAQPSFDPWESWRLLEQANPNGGTRYLARYRTWTHESPLLFHERVRLPPAEQGWQLRRRQDDVRLDGDYAEEILRRLGAVRIPPYVDHCPGHDGTGLELTLGFEEVRLSWWEGGPEEWQELVELMREFWAAADRRRSIQSAGC